MQTHTGLHRDYAQGVSDHIVQLLGDAQALIGGRTQRTPAQIRAAAINQLAGIGIVVPVPPAPAAMAAAPVGV